MFTTAQKGWSWLLTHAIAEVAKAIGGSFKLVTLTLKTVRKMTQLPWEAYKDVDTQTNQRNTLEAQAAKWAHMPIPSKARHYARTLKD